jgi:hypothetical protein
MVNVDGDTFRSGTMLKITEKLDFQVVTMLEVCKIVNRRPFLRATMCVSGSFIDKICIIKNPDECNSREILILSWNWKA